METVKKLIWLGNSLETLKSFPEEVKDSIGYSLHKVQTGMFSRNAKFLKGFKVTVMEIVTDYDTNTYRAIYTIKIENTVCVLRCFQKKSKKGIATPKQEIDLIKQRLREADELLNQSKR